MLRKSKNLLNLVKQLDINNNIDYTINSAKPPIFWKEKDVIKKQMQNWKTDNIKELIEDINQCELN